MKDLLPLLPLFTYTLFISGCCERSGKIGDGDSHLANLQGNWTVVSMTVDGEPMPVDELCQMRRLTIDGTTMTQQVGDFEVGSHFRLDPAQSPKAIDVLTSDGTLINRGIYRLEGNRLTICEAGEAGPRPQQFTSTEELRQSLTILRRGEPKADELPEPFKNLEFARAVVTLHYDEKGQYLEGKTITLTDADKVRELSSYFPGLGQGRKSPMAAGWEGSLTIAFEHREGETVEVWTDPEMELWSEGHGDWKVKPGLRDFVLRQFD